MKACMQQITREYLVVLKSAYNLCQNLQCVLVCKKSLHRKDGHPIIFYRPFWMIVVGSHPKGKTLSQKLISFLSNFSSQVFMAQMQLTSIWTISQLMKNSFILFQSKNHVPFSLGLHTSTRTSIRACSSFQLMSWVSLLYSGIGLLESVAGRQLNNIALRGYLGILCSVIEFLSLIWQFYHKKSTESDLVQSTQASAIMFIRIFLILNLSHSTKYFQDTSQQEQLMFKDENQAILTAQYLNEAILKSNHSSYKKLYSSIILRDMLDYSKVVILQSQQPFSAAKFIKILFLIITIQLIHNQEHFYKLNTQIHEEKIFSTMNSIPKDLLCISCKQYLTTCQCCIYCKYCHQTHRIADMPKGLCPKMEKYSKQLVKAKTYECMKCKGSGYYYKRTEILIEESQKAYQQRLSSWQLYKNKKNPPQKKVISRKTKALKISCSACSETGMIERYKYCCAKGCIKCHFSGVAPSRRWRKCKKQFNAVKSETLAKKAKKSSSQLEAICNICQQKYTVDIKTEALLIDQCSHIVHWPCVARIQQKNPGYCPECKDQESEYFKDLQNSSFDSQYSENLFLFSEQASCEEVETVNSLAQT